MDENNPNVHRSNKASGWHPIDDTGWFHILYSEITKNKESLKAIPKLMRSERFPTKIFQGILQLKQKFYLSSKLPVGTEVKLRWLALRFTTYYPKEQWDLLTIQKTRTCYLLTVKTAQCPLSHLQWALTATAIVFKHLCPMERQDK